MRFFEFASADVGLDKFVMILKNYIGRASSKKAPTTLNWAGLQHIFRTSGFEFASDYETFKSIYDTSPVIQSLVKDFNQDGITLNVPGAPDAEQPTQDQETSQDKVDQTADSAAAGQLAQQQATPKAPAQA